MRITQLLSRALLVLFGLALSLTAQDVTVSDLTWLDPERPSADTPPAYKKRLAPRYPEELAKNNLHAYAICVTYVHADGNDFGRSFSGDALIENAIEAATGGDSFTPAAKEGQPIGTWAISTVIFNPARAKPDSADSAPRILNVSPITAPQKHFPKKTEKIVVPATLHLDAEGKLTGVDLPTDLAAELKAAIDASLPQWNFSPAREANQAVAGPLSLSLVIQRPLLGENYDIKTRPQNVKLVSPSYPYALHRHGVGGQVLCSFVVDKEGNVKNAYAMGSSHPFFREAALEALREWKFKPATLNGVPVASRVEIAIQFTPPGNAQGGGRITGGPKDPTKLPEGFRYDKAPEPRTSARPVYPYSLLANKTAGRAKVIFVVATDGKVREATIIEATHPEFGQALAAAASLYRFKPATLNGEPTNCLITVEHNFDPHGDNGFTFDEDLDLLKIEARKPEQIIKASQLDRPLKAFSRKSPVTPILNDPQSPAPSPDTTAKAVIQFLVDKHGKVRLPRIMESTTPAHGYAAIQAVAEWRFEMPLSGGKPVIVRVQAPFNFNAASSPKPEDAAKTE